MRRNIFDMMKDRTSGFTNVDRMDRLLRQEAIFDYARAPGVADTYSLIYFVTEKCFDTWKARGHCIDLSDYLATLQYQELLVAARNGDIDALLTYIELLYNLWYLPQWKKAKYMGGLTVLNGYYLLKRIMDDTLADFNYRIYEDAENERALVIEDKPGVTAVAEIINPELAFDVIRYNHYALKGEMADKKAILLRFLDDLEPKRDQIEEKLAQNIFFMANNFNLRHNNVNPEGGGKYYPYVAQLSDEELEGWYDELYQMILLAHLSMDNAERSNKLEALRQQRKGGKS